MKHKFLLIVALALLLIGVAYVRSLLSHQDRDNVFSTEVTQVVPPEILDDYLEKEEAARTLDSLKAFYADSLNKLTTYWSAAIESQPHIISDSLEALIGQLRIDLSRAEKNVTKAKNEKTEQFEKLIATFYKGEISQLPPDLTKYEREVSLKEIKSKAQKYFYISEKTLNKIVSKYK